MTDVVAQAGTADPATRRALVQELADRLGEAERGPRAPRPDGSRRRTPGGGFFHLVRRGVDREERRQIFPPGAQRPAGRGDGGTAGPTRPPGATGRAFTWDDYPAAIADVRQEIGEATTVKITVIGRPARVVERGDVAIVTLRSDKAPSLPKGLPAPAQPTDYAVLIARKQWLRVAQAAANPQDLLIIEGAPTLDPRFSGITVLAANTTTKQLQQAERQRKQVPAGVSGCGGDLMAKAGAGGLTPLRVRAVRAFLEAAGYTAVPGKHKHRKLRHPARPPVLLPLQPQTMLSFSAARQIGAALGYPDAQAFVAAVTAKEQPPAPRRAHDT